MKSIEKKFQLDVHEVPIGIPEQHIYMMWHVNREHDSGHKWLRDSMMQTTWADQ